MTREEAEFEIECLKDFTIEEIHDEYKVDTLEEAEAIIRSKIEEEYPEEEFLGDIYSKNGFKDMADCDRFING